MARLRGAKPSPRAHLCAATPHRIVGATPSQWCWIPKKLSFWLNNVDGDCVTAEEAFARACMGIFIQDSTVQAWATQHGVMNGAVISEVLDWMNQKGFSQDGNVYNAGSKLSVDYTNPAVLQNAISKGPVKIGVAADQLERAVGNHNGWVATNFTPDQNLDHCTSLPGYGTFNWMAGQLGVSLPSGVDGNKQGYLFFTWNTIGMIDHPSLIAITGEAWLRTPTNVTIGNNPPTPDDVITPTPTPTPNPNPNPNPPVPIPIPSNIVQQVDAIFAAVEAQFWYLPRFVKILKDLNKQIDDALTNAELHLLYRVGGHVPQSIIVIVDAAFDGAVLAFPQYAMLLKAAKVIIDQLLVIA